MHKVGLPARGYNSGGLNMTGAFVKVPIDTVDAGDDLGGYFDHTTNHRYNVPNPGVYKCLWVVTVGATADAQSVISALYRGNGGGAAAVECYGALAQAAAALAPMASPGGMDVTCVAGDWFELWCDGTTGRAVTATKYATCLSVQQVA